ncbi:unnamed protein product [Dibothriocephalus latus]|uniref:Uncharacterized protein n=1 Tax=Dibothriocephalus latus TaxID=60516 RepID=A0A3P7M8V2_DIBLA|nr:unnamed protein product [Dibothriocephalus latus]
MTKDFQRNPKRQDNKTLVPVISSSSSELLPGTRIFSSIGRAFVRLSTSSNLFSPSQYRIYYTSSLAPLFFSSHAEQGSKIAVVGVFPIDVSDRSVVKSMKAAAFRANELSICSGRYPLLLTHRAKFAVAVTML